MKCNEYPYQFRSIDNSVIGTEEIDQMHASLENMRLLKYFHEQGMDYRKHSDLCITPDADDFQFLPYPNKNDLIMENGIQYLRGIHHLPPFSSFINFYFEEDGDYNINESLLVSLKKLKLIDSNIMIFQNFFSFQEDEKDLIIKKNHFPEFDLYFYQIRDCLVISYDFFLYHTDIAILINKLLSEVAKCQK